MRTIVVLALLVVAAPAWAQEGATISGVVKWKGKKPERKPVEGVAGTPFCEDKHKDKPLLDESLVVNKGPGGDVVQNVLVYVSKGLEGKKFDAPQTPAKLDQVGCAYTPHVVAVMAGQTLELHSSDDTLHNVNATPHKNKVFNVAMPMPMSIPQVFKNPELKVSLQCSMHPWMRAYVHVLEHPFFAVTGADGTFTIKDLPPGEYELSVVQESPHAAPNQPKMTVKVGAGEQKKVDFTYHAQ